MANPGSAMTFPTVKEISTKGKFHIPCDYYTDLGRKDIVDFPKRNNSAPALRSGIYAAPTTMVINPGEEDEIILHTQASNSYAKVDGSFQGRLINVHNKNTEYIGCFIFGKEYYRGRFALTPTAVAREEGRNELNNTEDLLYLIGKAIEEYNNVEFDVTFLYDKEANDNIFIEIPSRKPNEPSRKINYASICRGMVNFLNWHAKEYGGYIPKLIDDGKVTDEQFAISAIVMVLLHKKVISGWADSLAPYKQDFIIYAYNFLINNEYLKKNDILFASALLRGYHDQNKLHEFEKKLNVDIDKFLKQYYAWEEPIY